MNCPYCNSDKHAIKAGLRHIRQGTIQKYYCKHCNKYFTDRIQPYTQYPSHVILYTPPPKLYNQGSPIKKAKTLTEKNTGIPHQNEQFIHGSAATKTYSHFSNYEKNLPLIPTALLQRTDSAISKSTHLPTIISNSTSIQNNSIS